jgi:hypothetical protein
MQNSTVDKLKEQAALRAQKEAVEIENIDEYKKALNGMASSEYGKLFLKTLLKYCNIFEYNNSLDGMKLIENNAKKNLYVYLIRQFLEPEIRRDIES